MADRIGKGRAAEIRRSAKSRRDQLTFARRLFERRAQEPPRWLIVQLTKALRVAERREKKRKAA